MNADDTRAKLSGLIHPVLGRELGKLDMIKQVDERKVTLDLLTAAHPGRDELLALLEKELPGLKVELTTTQRSTQPALGGGLLSGVKNIVAVASGKGGVGKSTVASNLAAALALEGSAVGLLDADIYGPSIPALLGLESSSVALQDKRIVPAEKFGLKVMSMGFLMKPGDSVIWRGPMLHGMVQQFCKDVLWGELDFLVVDLPPGTGDVSLSLSQLVPLGGAVLVTTPQEVALGVATKAVNMFGKLNVPMLGLIENMSYYACPHCHQRDDVFGHGGAKLAAERLGLPFLGEVPLNSVIREAGDKGQPVVVSNPDSEPARALRDTARLIAGRLAMAAVLGS